MMSWLALFFALEVGMLPVGFIESYEANSHEVQVLGGTYYVDMQADVWLFDLFFIGGRTKIYMRGVEGEISFVPNTAEFAFNAGFKAGILEVGFRHYCVHPIVPWIYRLGGSFQWEGGYEEIYVRIEGGI